MSISSILNFVIIILRGKWKYNSFATNGGAQVFDLTQLRTVTNPPVLFNETAHYRGFGSAHNIVINEDWMPPRLLLFLITVSPRFCLLTKNFAKLLQRLLVRHQLICW